MEPDFLFETEAFSLLQTFLFWTEALSMLKAVVVFCDAKVSADDFPLELFLNEKVDPELLLKNLTFPIKLTHDIITMN